MRYKTDKMSLYPNPVSDLLTVDSPSVGNVAIYKHLGLKIGDYQLVEGQNEVDMSEMNSGVYSLKFSDGSVERVVKN